jgi:pyrimidine deaminase RibD-like protein
MSILQDVGTYTGRAYENPYMGCLISTFIGTRKLCTLVISMHMSILQDIDTYTGRAYENPYMGCLISTS